MNGNEGDPRTESTAENPFAPSWGEAPQAGEPSEPSESHAARLDHRAWAWVPSLYFAEGLPYMMVMTVSVIMYKSLGLENDVIVFSTSWLYLPWVIKPLWSPLVDVLGSQRTWVLVTQALMALAFVAIAAQLRSASFFTLTLASFALLAICSATHDIAADGFYMAGLEKRTQAWFVGIRSTFYRLSMIAAQGGLVMLAGALEGDLGPSQAWQWTMATLGVLFGGVCLYHCFVLPRPASRSESARAGNDLFDEMVLAVTTFFEKPGIVAIVAYLLLYRFAESQLVKIAAPFLMDPPTAGGLGLSTARVGQLYGVVGVSLLLAGGVLGGVLGAKFGVRRCLLPMALAINLPNVVYVLLAVAKPTSVWPVAAAIAVEQFGYGLGFAGYLLIMLYVSRGEHQTAHYALCTGLMALGMMLPGMFSGDLQLWLGYQWFFVWVLAATIPSFVVTELIRRQVDE
ncbi:MAG: MFS transporter [Planctomycetales bacterium]|nr:MFS transporter [Planctomycetales bacterium]